MNLRYENMNLSQRSCTLSNIAREKHDKSILVNFLISNLLVLQTVDFFKIVALALSSTSDGTWLELDRGSLDFYDKQF